MLESTLRLGAGWGSVGGTLANTPEPPQAIATSSPVATSYFAYSPRSMSNSPAPDVVDRRAVVGTAAACFVAAALAAACSGTSTASSSGTTLAGIATAGRFAILPAADAIVINTGAGFVALSKTCTHSSCGLARFNNSTSLLECNCHGSRFRTSGQVATGPATTALRSYPVTVNGGVITFSV